MRRTWACGQGIGGFGRCWGAGVRGGGSERPLFPEPLPPARPMSGAGDPSTPSALCPTSLLCGSSGLTGLSLRSLVVHNVDCYLVVESQQGPGVAGASQSLKNSDPQIAHVDRLIILAVFVWGMVARGLS